MHKSNLNTLAKFGDVNFTWTSLPEKVDLGAPLGFLLDLGGRDTVPPRLPLASAEAAAAARLWPTLSAVSTIQPGRKYREPKERSTTDLTDSSQFSLRMKTALDHAFRCLVFYVKAFETLLL